MHYLRENVPDPDDSELDPFEQIDRDEETLDNLGDDGLMAPLYSLLLERRELPDPDDWEEYKWHQWRLS